MSTTDADGFVVDVSSSGPSPAPSATPAPESAPGEGQPSRHGDVPAPPVAEPASPEPPEEDEGDDDQAARDRARGIERNPDGTFKPRKDSPAHRISHLTWEREEARRQAQAERERADQLHVELERYRRSQQAPAQAPRPSAPDVSAEGPQLDQFDTYEQFTAAQARWFASLEAEAKLEAFKAELIAQQREQVHYERLDQFAAQQPDFVPALQASADLPISAAMREAILTSPHGPALAYYLATHQEEGLQLTQETASLPPSAAPSVRRLLERLAHASPAASTGPVAGSRPSVPAPISPVGAAPVVAETSPDALEFGPEYVRRMNERERKQGRR